MEGREEAALFAMLFKAMGGGSVTGTGRDRPLGSGEQESSISTAVATTTTTTTTTTTQLDQEQPTGRGYAQTANAVKCAGPLLPIPELKVAACGLCVLGSLKSGFGT